MRRYVPQLSQKLVHEQTPLERMREEAGLPHLPHHWFH